MRQLTPGHRQECRATLPRDDGLQSRWLDRFRRVGMGLRSLPVLGFPCSQCIQHVRQRSTIDRSILQYLVQSPLFRLLNIRLLDAEGSAVRAGLIRPKPYPCLSCKPCAPTNKATPVDRLINGSFRPRVCKNSFLLVRATAHCRWAGRFPTIYQDQRR